MSLRFDLRSDALTVHIIAAIPPRRSSCMSTIGRPGRDATNRTPGFSALATQWPAVTRMLGAMKNAVPAAQSVPSSTRRTLVLFPAFKRFSLSSSNEGSALYVRAR
jgi:hypothetical protein